jgi:chorismate dehydratase
MSALKVGSVPYLVGRPLNFGLEREPGIELSFDVPARLSHDLRTGALDVALVSSIELFRHPGSTYLPGLGVIGEGYVGSVQVFLNKPLAEIRAVHLDPVSRTGQTLVQVLAHQAAGMPRDLAFIEVPFGEDPRATASDAWLRIGDRALEEHLREGLPHYNPSEAWVQLTGLPFVFAAWIARPGIDLEPYRDAFEAAAARGQAQAQDLARASAQESQLDPAAVVHYLCNECSFAIAPDRQALALSTFDQLARQAGVQDPGAGR